MKTIVCKMRVAKTYFQFPVLLFLSLSVVNCTKEPVDYSRDNVVASKDLNAIAKVDSPETLLDLLTNAKGNLTRANEMVDYGENFVSMMDVCDVVDDEPVTYYDLKDYGELVPNTDFASLINTKGEIQVGNTIYRITKAGTYYFDTSLRNKVDSMIDELDETQGTSVGEWTVELAEGIMRYNTFEEAGETEIIDVPDSYCDAIGQYNNGGYGGIDSPIEITGMTRAPIIPKNYPTFYVDRHTVVGEAIENLIGTNRSYEVYTPQRHRRLKGKLYYYNYAVYSEMGIEGTYQKNQWIGWSKKTVAEMGIIYSDVVVELDLPNPDPSIPAPVPTTPTVMGYYTGMVPGSTVPGNVLVLGGIDPTSQSFKDAVMKGPNEIVRYIDGKLGRQVFGTQYQAILFIKGRQAYSLFYGVGVKKTNIASMSKTFSSNLNIEIKVPSDPGNWRAWFNAIKGESSATKLQHAKGMIECWNGGEWLGMILVKRFD